MSPSFPAALYKFIKLLSDGNMRIAVSITNTAVSTASSASII